MSPDCYTTWRALRFLGSLDGRVHESRNIACLSAVAFTGSLRVHATSWRKIKREGWVEVDPARHDPGPDWTVWKLSEAGRRRFKALAVGEKGGGLPEEMQG